ncbi:MAG: nicotinate-nucleotide adenylyltransferase [Clostridia bacterium]|nr:nicotinate-nucleotide adenylyltransferase [Clostridia bacterium]
MRIGIFGGSFNPPHLGHMLIATEVKEKAELDRLIFMPCAIQPHKAERVVPDGTHRFNMVCRSIGNNSGFEVSELEIKAGGKSYTAKTLEELGKIFPDDRLCFIVGADSLCEMDTWFCPEYIFRSAEIIVTMRGGMDERELDNSINFLRNKYNADIRKVQMNVIEMSSSNIRQRIAEGKSIKYMVSDDVIEYIRENSLYEGCSKGYAEV